jgi:tetratricopeptide (TPR) repeat protein
LAGTGQHQDLEYRGLYLLGPLPEPRGLGQERYPLFTLENPYPPELEEAISERARLLASLKNLKNVKGQEEAYRKNLAAVSSLERRLGLRWERLRADYQKLAKIQGHNWPEYLSSLGLRHRFFARQIISLKSLMEQTNYPSPRNPVGHLIKTAQELRASLLDLPELAKVKLPKGSRGAAAREAGAKILAILEEERLRVLDRILIAEKFLTLARAQDQVLEPAPEPVDVPRLYEVAWSEKPQPKPLKILTLVTLFLLVLALVYFFVLKTRAMGPENPPRPGRLLVVNGLAATITVLFNNQSALSIGPGAAQLTHLREETTKAQVFLRDGPFVEEIALTRPPLSDLEITLVYNVAEAAALAQLGGTKEAPGELGRRPSLPLGAPKVLYSRANVFLPPPNLGLDPILLWNPPDQAKNILGLRAIAGLDPDSVIRALKPDQQRSGSSDPTLKNLLRAQGLYDAYWDQWASLWLLRLVQAFPHEARAILQTRWEYYPSDLTTRKFLFDLSDPKAQAELCQDTLARIAVEQERLDDQYLVTWCLPAAERGPHLRERLKEFINDNYLLSALGRVEFDQGQYPEAFRLWNDVMRRDSGKMVFELENFGRLGHYLGVGGFEIYELLNRWVPELGQKAVWEECEDPGDPEESLGQARAYCYLAKGQPSEALELATGEFRDRILPLVAASEGAEPELMAEILAQPPERGLTRDNAWVKLALALKLGQDSRLIEELIVGEAVNKELMVGLIGALKNREPEKIPGLLANVDARLWGEACLAAYLTAQEPESLADCREKAKGFLFSSERPYLK